MPTARPIRRMTSAICSSTGMNWLGIAIRLVVAMTAVIARSSGTTAATAEPKTRSRITSVSGIATSPAVFSMLLKAASVALVVVTLPSWLTSKPGCLAAVLLTAASILSM